MKPIYLQLDELGPWMKFTTPPVSPRRRILSSNMHLPNNRRVRTVYMNSTINDSFIMDEPFSKHISQDLPSIEPPNRQSFPKPINEPINIKDLLTQNAQFNSEVISESQHVTHQYFPYRQTSINFWQKSFRPLPTKNTYPTANKKMRNYSMSPNTKKNYVFWNQRKLVGIKVKKTLN